MQARAGVGHSEATNSRQAGAEAARRAVESGNIDRANLALLFSTAKHDAVQLRDGVRDVIGPRAKLVGGHAVGIITHDFLAYDGCEVGLALIQSDAIRVDSFIETGLPNNELEVGSRLGRQIGAARSASSDGEQSLLLFYDSVHQTDGQPRLNRATPLLQGISQYLNPWPRAAGLGMIGSMQLSPSFQWFDDRVEQQAAIALVLSRGVRMDTVIMHGCRPASVYHTITKTDGPVVLEIDGRPALDVIAALLGPDTGLSWDDYAFFVTLGVNKGDRFGDFREQDYANRLCIGIDAVRQGLVMFETDLVPGMQVQLMRRSMDLNYIGERTRELLALAAGRRAIVAFYIDCAGRAAAYCGMDEEEAAAVQKALPADIPLLGVYSGVEIAKVGGSIQALDWTGVLCLFSV